MYNQKLLKNYLKIFGSVERSSDICIVDSSTMTGYLWSTTPERREVQDDEKGFVEVALVGVACTFSLKGLGEWLRLRSGLHL